ncbi:hypothetical protein [Yoonia vestfoldensis]|uniref:hypothetical protein n=1 Tax=Yoonia vestfoldensis TaxID=245188 RepID=UPI00036FE92D|nr:hypothetical protein [Yoonia vestfoldensis]
MNTLRAATLALCLAGTSAMSDAENTHQFMIIDQQVGDVLREYATAFGLSINMDPAIEGRLTNFSGIYTTTGFLDAVTARFGLVWYDDGVTIHVSPLDEMKSVVIDFNGMPPAALTAALTDMGAHDPRFALRETTAGIGIVTGPPRYVELVENTFLMLAQRDTPDAPVRPAHNMIVIRGESVVIWNGTTTPDPEPATGQD